MNQNEEKKLALIEEYLELFKVVNTLNAYEREELKNLKEPIFLVGDGSNLCYNTLSESVPNLVLPGEHRMHQRASGVALAAAKLVSAGAPGDANALTPNYLRLSQAERERAERRQAHRKITERRKIPWQMYMSSIIP